MAVSISKELVADLTVCIDGQRRVIACKTIKSAMHLDGLQAFRMLPNDSGKTQILLYWLDQWSLKLETPRVGESCTLPSLLKNVRAVLTALADKGIVKTEAARYYLELVVMRPLLHMRALLRQKLASTAPAARLTLRNRPRHIFASHPPAAPPAHA